jgi:hypothetical protein
MTLALTLTLLLAGPIDAPEAPLARLGRLDHPPIREASGLVRSRRHPDVFWTHNDSGNPPALFAVRRDGSLVREFAVAVPNIDWEDIAADDQGHLYLADTGNNGGRLPLRAVYQLDEPDPLAQDSATTTVRARSATYYRLPPDDPFDAEALILDGARALLVAKSRTGQPAAIYAIPLVPPAPLLRPATPQKVGTLAGFTAPVTGASLSDDGRKLAVCSLRALGVYAKGPKDAWTPVALRSFRSDDQVEAVAWDDDDLILAGEARGVYRVAAEDLAPRSAPPRRPGIVP